MHRRWFWTCCKKQLYFFLFISFLIVIPSQASALDRVQTNCRECQPYADQLNKIIDEMNNITSILQSVEEAISDLHVEEGKLKVWESQRKLYAGVDDARLDAEIKEIKSKIAQLKETAKQKPDLKKQLDSLEGAKANWEKDLKICEQDCTKKLKTRPPLPPLRPTVTCPSCHLIGAVLDKTKNDIEKITQEVNEYEAEIKALRNAIMEYEAEQGRLAALAPRYQEGPDGKITSKDISIFFGRIEEVKLAIQRREDRLEKCQKWLADCKAEKAELEDKKAKLETELKECQETKCKYHSSAPSLPVPPITSTPQTKTACSSIPYKPVQIGPQSEFGSGAVKVVQDTVKNVAGGLIGGFLGRSPVSVGGPTDKPQLDSNPFEKMNTFTNSETGTIINLAGKMTDKGMLIATGVEEGEGKPTIHCISLHRDDDCSIEMPSEYFLYELWLEWWLTVNWTKTTYINNQQVKQESGGWSKSGSLLLDRGVFAANQAGLGSIWQHFGFDRATQGPKLVGVGFSLAKGAAVKFPDKVVVHITRPNQDPVTTVPFIFKVSQKPDGSLGFDQLMGMK